MTNRQQIQAIPGSLRMTLEKARAEYGGVIRKIRWGDGPLFVCGAGQYAPLGLAAGYAFEAFPEWPVVAHSADAWRHYGLSLFHPRSVLVMISPPGEWPEAQELVRSARERGCTIVALTHAPDAPLAKLADHLFLIHADGEPESPNVAVGTYAALNELAFAAMRVLKKPRPWWEQMERELEQLPEKLDWIFTQLPSVVRSMAAEVARLPRLTIVGAGFLHYPAVHAAQRLRALPKIQAAALEAAEFMNADAQFAKKGDTVLLLSGSQSKMKKSLHRCAAQARSNGARVLSLTDANDRELCDSSDLGLMVPSLHEAPASILALFMLEWLATEALRA